MGNQQQGGPPMNGGPNQNMNGGPPRPVMNGGGGPPMNGGPTMMNGGPPRPGMQQQPQQNQQNFGGGYQ
jgi:hypothetical protein